MSLIHWIPNFMIPGFRARESEQRHRRYAELPLTCVHDWPVTSWLPGVECHKCGMRGKLSPEQMKQFLEKGTHPNTMQIEILP